MADSLVVRAGGESHTIPLQQVVEVLRMVAVTPGGGEPPWVLGTIDRRGETTAVVDLARHLDLPVSAPSLSARIVVCAVDDRTIGVLVDDAEGLVSGAAAAGAVDLHALASGLR